MAEQLVEIKYDEAKLARVRKMLRDIPQGMPRVMSKAINRTATSARAEISRRISGRVKINISAVKKGIALHRASYSRWQAVLDLVTRRIPLIKFGAKQLKTGVSYQISKLEGRKRVTEPPYPFIQTMPSGHRGVFRRHRPTTKRLPIIQLLGPSIGAVFEGAGKIAADVQQETSKKLEKNIDDQVKFILARR